MFMYFVAACTFNQEPSGFLNFLSEKKKENNWYMVVFSLHVKAD